MNCALLAVGLVDRLEVIVFPIITGRRERTRFWPACPISTWSSSTYGCLTDACSNSSTSRPCAERDQPIRPDAAAVILVMVGGGGCIPRAPGGPVDLDRYALRVGSRLDQVERNVRAGVGEQPRALADDHGIREQGDLVDQVVVEQPADQRAAAVHLQLTRRLGFQLADGSRNVTGEDGRVRPLRVVSVFDATYFGRVFNATEIGLLP